MPVSSDIRCPSISFLFWPNNAPGYLVRYLLDSIVYLPAISLAHAFSHNDRTPCALITMRLCHLKSLAAGIDECNIREQIHGRRED